MNKVLFVWGTLFAFQLHAQDSLKGRVLNVVPIDGYSKDQVHTADLTSSSPRYELTTVKMLELGIMNVGDAMRFVPGAQLKDYGGMGGLKTVSFRSLGASHTAVVADWNTQHSMQRGAVNLGGYNAFGLKSVAFNSGQPNNPLLSASAYLPASFIEFTSDIAQADTALSVQIQQSYSTINQYTSAFNVNVPIRERAFIAAQFNTTYGNGSYNYEYNLTGSEEPFTRLNTRLQFVDAKLAGGFQHKKSYFRLIASHNNHQQELPGAVILFNPSHDQTLDRSASDIQFNYRFFDKKWLMTAHGGAKQEETFYHDPTYLNADGFLTAEYIQKSGNAGVMLNRILRAYKERVFLGSDVVVGLLDGTSFNGSPQRLSANSVVGLSYWLGPLKIESNVSHQFIHDQSVQQDSTQLKQYSKFSPYLGLSVQPLKQVRWKIRGFYKNAFRMPSFNDLYYNFIGNTALQPEDAHLANVGMTLALKNQQSEQPLTAEFSLDAFYNIIQNKIVAIPTKDLFNWSMQNIGRTHIRGIDFNLSVSKKIKEWQVSFSTSQTINYAVDKTDESSLSYNHQIPYTPIFSSSNTFLIDYQGYQLTSNAIIQGKRYSLNENIASNEMPAYTDWSLGLQKTFKIKDFHQLFTSVKCNNILNNNFEVIRSFPMPGRHLLIILKYQFK